MGKIIEVRLSDAQYAALWTEAEASGQKFFEHCRAKLVGDGSSYGIGPAMVVDLPIVKAENERKRRETVAREVAVQGPPTDDRISRIEDAVARLTEFVLNGQVPAAPPSSPLEPIDVDSLVDAQFREAEASGLTEPMPDETEIEMQASGVRALSRRPIPFSARGVPRHLQDVL